MRTLTLIRHAKSNWNDDALSDFNRPLNACGRAAAPAMGQRLRALGASFDLIVSSPALRAISTAQLLAESLGYPRDVVVKNIKLYAADREVLLDVVQQLPDDTPGVALVGHNPGLTEFCTYLCGEHIDLPTCAVARIEFNIDAWQAVYRDGGRLTQYAYPRQFAD
jgi:phosphohistidine phosphatase